MRIISITNQKGGAGKTTTTVNLSASLAVQGQKVLVIDLDPQANASTHFSVRNPAKSICDLLLDEDIDGLVHNYEAEVSGRIDIIPSQIGLASLENQLVDELGREGILKRQITKLPLDYDFILFDCPPSLGIFTLNALTASNEVLIPVEAEYFALLAVKSLLQTVAAVRAKLNPGLGRVSALLTQFDTRNNICHQIRESTQERFKGNAFKTVIRKNVALVDAAVKGAPVIFSDPNAYGSHDYLQLAKEVLEVAR